MMSSTKAPLAAFRRPLARQCTDAKLSDRDGRNRDIIVVVDHVVELIAGPLGVDEEGGVEQQTSHDRSSTSTRVLTSSRSFAQSASGRWRRNSVLHVGAEPAIHRFEVGNRFAAPHDRELLAAMFDGVEEIGEVSSCVGGRDVRHELRLSDLGSDWGLNSTIMSNSPIAEHALLSDCHSAALVHESGSVEWLCFPRFDSPSVFGRLLDHAAGHWSIRPVESAEITRRYLPETMILETTFRTATGTAVLVDALAVGPNERGHELGAGAPSALLRRVTGVEGTLDLDVEYAPRPEYGLIVPVLEPQRGGVLARGGATVLTLSSPVEFTTDDLVARARVSVDAGATIGFALHHRTTSQPAPPFWSQDEIGARIDDTTQAWRTWSSLHQSYEGPWEHLVHHSGRVLYALHYYPTGAICAAATTSLPESIGGSRNWDYRYAWVRDASFTLHALWVAACPDEADQFFDYSPTRPRHKCGAAKTSRSCSGSAANTI